MHLNEIWYDYLSNVLCNSFRNETLHSFLWLCKIGYAVFVDIEVFRFINKYGRDSGLG